MMIAYGQSKTANVLFAGSLDARGQSAGIRAFAVHPGAVVDFPFLRDRVSMSRSQ